MKLLINNRPAIRKNAESTLTTSDNCYKNINGDRVLITFTNHAKASDAENVAQDVFSEGDALCHFESYFKKSSGDEAGDLLGETSNTIQGKAEFISHSPNVYINGKPAVHKGNLMVSNNKNTKPAPVI